MNITPVILNLTDMQLVCLKDAIAERYHMVSGVVNNPDLYPDQRDDNPQRLSALRDLHNLMDQY